MNIKSKKETKMRLVVLYFKGLFSNNTWFIESI